MGMGQGTRTDIPSPPVNPMIATPSVTPVAPGPEYVVPAPPPVVTPSPVPVVTPPPGPEYNASQNLAPNLDLGTFLGPQNPDVPKVSEKHPAVTSTISDLSKQFDQSNPSPKVAKAMDTVTKYMSGLTPSTTMAGVTVAPEQTGSIGGLLGSTGTAVPNTYGGI